MWKIIEKHKLLSFIINYMIIILNILLTIFRSFQILFLPRIFQALKTICSICWYVLLIKQNEKSFGFPAEREKYKTGEQFKPFSIFYVTAWTTTLLYYLLFSSFIIYQVFKWANIWNTKINKQWMFV